MGKITAQKKLSTSFKHTGVSPSHFGGAHGGSSGAAEQEEGAQELAVAAAGRQMHSGLAMAVGGTYKGLSSRAGRLQQAHSNAETVRQAGRYQWRPALIILIRRLQHQCVARLWHDPDNQSCILMMRSPSSR